MDKRSKTSSINGKLGGRPKELLELDILKNENWRIIKGFESYFVSDFGRVCSVKSGKPKLLSLFEDKDGYLKCSLCNSLYVKRFSVHTLVLTAFSGNRPKGLEASHLDGNSGNNKLDNLKWETAKENYARKVLHGTAPLGSLHYCSKLNESQVYEIKRLLSIGMTQINISKMFNISRRTIGHISEGKKWKHVKYDSPTRLRADR
jgi:hypothetical protein